MIKKILILFFTLFIISCKNINTDINIEQKILYDYSNDIKDSLIRMEEAEKKLGFKINLPKFIKNFDKKEIKVIGGTLLEVTYINERVKGIYPTIKIIKSGDKTKVDEIDLYGYKKETKKINDITLVLYTKDNYIKYACWYKNSFFYSFKSNTKGIYREDAEKLFELIISIN